ncbi:MAG: sugar ABC transporter ATP-binding protein [Ilumatobacteraceae bacterium]
MVFVSHFLDEVLAVADRVTIMRDGQVVRTSAASDETHTSLVEAMTGRRSGQLFPDRVPAPDDAPAVLTVEGLTREGQFSDIDLQVRAGEIVGLAGLVGAGRSELAHAIYGATRPDSGRVTIDGEPHRGTVADGIRRRIALIPESRRHQGLVMRRSVADNVTLPLLDRFRTMFGLSSRQISTVASDACRRAGVKAESMAIAVDSLSGGNQQKVLFGRSLLAAPKLLIADEPTRGVDVGAKQSIYELVVEMAANGCGVLLISSEIEEVIGLSHRIAVMRGGRIVAELTGAEMTEDNVLTAAFADVGDAASTRSEHA